MTPNLGQGACQAIEDAVVLAALRLGRIAQMESTPARWLRDRLLTLTPASITRRQLVRSLRFEI